MAHALCAREEVKGLPVAIGRDRNGAACSGQPEAQALFDAYPPRAFWGLTLHGQLVGKGLGGAGFDRLDAHFIVITHVDALGAEIHDQAQIEALMPEHPALLTLPTLYRLPLPCSSGDLIRWRAQAIRDTPFSPLLREVFNVLEPCLGLTFTSMPVPAGD